MNCVEKLFELTSCIGVTGHEECLANKLKDEFSQYELDVRVDKFYNVIAKKKGKARRSVMLTAHMDEIGLMVKGIDDRGFILFTNIGGIDPKVLISQEVIVHGKRELYGIIGQKPPHLMTKEEYSKVQTINELSIDVGYTKEQLKDIVAVGNVITFRSHPIVLNKHFVSNKTMDNRSGVVTMLMVAELLKDVDTDVDIYFVVTTNEEFNLAGATVAAYDVNPDFAIVIDACHGIMSEVPKEETFEFDKGVIIGVGPNLHRKFTNKIIDVAKDMNISHQIDVEPGDTGTECWAIQVTRYGIPTALISIPVKYMHTTIEMVNEKDLKVAATVIKEVLSLSEEELGACVCY